MNDVDAVAKAVAEPTRREILRLVTAGEKTAGELAGHFVISRPAVSQHLRVLTDADLVTVRAEGTKRFFSARPEGLLELREWMDGVWSASLARLAVEVERDQWNQRKGTSPTKQPRDRRDDKETP